ncbi:hypothetical protein NPIL_541 [Nephila pilipes]|uniref:Uncharacterized protein n=1 Tax=Nephila pilipes TaxID=299642 RepID=A0A8X6R1Q7_NEPPI|nr:hypothetical protein NPIL_541 [Nephila pilipes]
MAYLNVQFEIALMKGRWGKIYSSPDLGLELNLPEMNHHLSWKTQLLDVWAPGAGSSPQECVRPLIYHKKCLEVEWGGRIF